MTQSLPDLSGFHGGDTVYRHSLHPEIVYTEGVKCLAEAVGGFWIFDTIAAHNRYTPQVKAEQFQVWKLIVRTDHSAIWRMEDGNDHLVLSEEIAFTDFPAEGITLWCMQGTIMLPSEY